MQKCEFANCWVNRVHHCSSLEIGIDVSIYAHPLSKFQIQFDILIWAYVILCWGPSIKDVSIEKGGKGPNWSKLYTSSTWWVASIEARWIRDSFIISFIKPKHDDGLFVDLHMFSSSYIPVFKTPKKCQCLLWTVNWVFFTFKSSTIWSKLSHYVKFQNLCAGIKLLRQVSSNFWM